MKARKNYRGVFLSTIAVLGLTASGAFAQRGDFTAHHLITQKDYDAYAETLPPETKLELRQYLDYADREPCQNYQRPPGGLAQAGCDLDPPQMQMQSQRIQTPDSQQDLRPVITDYNISFDFNDSDIRESEQATLQRVVRDIERHNPYEVTIVGHTDRAGPADYNLALSRQRAETVSQALTARGVPNRILDANARGENDPAVPTPDGVQREENRRVEIQFRK